MSSKDAHLYSVPDAKEKKKGGKELTTGGSLAFSSQLSSLISSAKTSDRQTAGRAHKRKDDIFSKHNRNTEKRAQKDLDGKNGAFVLKASKSAGSADNDDWLRSKRKLEEKSRLYAAMRRGDVDADESKHMVDFDRKWAQTQDGEDGDRRWDNESSEGSEEEESEEQVEWTDEFGRMRTGTRSQMLRSQRGERAAEELAAMSRPAAPSQILYGDTIQSEAFNPDNVVAQRMSELAAKRDRSLTPPPDEHRDFTQEVRHKGVGFMQFSLDPERRKEQMEQLEKERVTTERMRGERDRKRKERQDMLDERRREIDVKRSRKEADKFLADMENDLAATRPTKDAQQEA